MKEDVITILKTVQNYDDQIALYFKQEQITYKTLIENILCLARHLKSMGLKPGDFIAVQLNNTPCFIYYFFAGLLNNLTLLPICDKLGVAEIERIMHSTNCNNLIINQHGHAQLMRNSDLLNQVEKVVMIDEQTENAVNLPFLDALKTKNLPPLSAFSGDYEADRSGLIYFTSGSTGKPKGIVHRYSILLKSCIFYKKYLGYNIQDKVCISVTMGYVLGSLVQMLPCLYAGAGLMIQPDMTAKIIVKAIVQQGITAVIWPPLLLNEVVKLSQNVKELTHQLRLVIVGGNKVPPLSLKAFHDRFKIEIQEGWGMTSDSRQNF